MNTYTLEVKPRIMIGKGLAALRRSGRVPGVVYGKGLEARSIDLDRKQFLKIWKQAKESSLVDLVLDKEKAVKVLIADVFKNPVSEEVFHVDFRQVRMDEKINAEIGLVFLGESPAVKELGGVLVKSLDTIRVSCLPGDLVPSFVVDLTPLKAFSDYIYVKDLKIPESIKVLENANEVVATVIAPRSEEELKALEEKPVEAVDTVERVEKEKKAEEEEGAAPGGAEASAKGGKAKAPETKEKENKK
jgi:large subunit ribosomal protein L25